MVRGATKAARRQRERRERVPRHILASIRDAHIRHAIDRDFEFARQDWSLVRCERCGCEQGSGPYPCALCGHGLARYA